ncbi:hypothetical protein AB0I81_32880 [Nonomuraea sp. NPDC050404]|uniref:hypothetical protein n=1 Tax=Nonomuraea sp. NPDC050404 TaxID=3155783 RepID=UPI0033E37FEB
MAVLPSSLTRLTVVAGACAALVLTTTAPAAAFPLPPQGVNPDQWHCGEEINNFGDRLCLKLNQVVGWWTGFNAEYHRSLDQGPEPMHVRFHWFSSAGQSGSLPTRGREFALTRGAVARTDSWAHLPSHTCLQVQAEVRHPDGFTYHSPFTVVCRDN